MKRILTIIITAVAIILSTTACEEMMPTASQVDKTATIDIGDKLSASQPTPTDLDYSLERYNLIRRTYWVNGQREKSRSVPQPLADIPLGYCVLFTESGAVVGNFVVDGKVSSLNSFLTPDSEYYEVITGSTVKYVNNWLPDVDGSYGANDNGIFFFTPDGKYIEWTGIYLYSDIPFEVDAPIVRVQ